MDSSLHCNAYNQEKINDPEVARTLGNFPPSLWGDYFLNFSMDNKLWERYSAEIEGFKEKVRSMFVCDERKPSEKMILIDTLQRLGVAYHFEHEIEEVLQQLFGNLEYNEDYDLYNIALHFRIFRQHGYNISCDAFNKFKGSDGKLKDTLANDVMGMLSLYEAANLAKPGEDILDEALIFTKTSLQSLISNLSSDLAQQVNRSLKLCLHRSLSRIEARNYIDTYRSDPLRNEMLLSFAKIDYNLLQLLHLQELSGIARWWSDLAAKFPYARDRIVECYFWTLGVYFEPHYSLSRIVLTKCTAMISLLDDTFDSYGTLDELEVFTEAVERWDASAIQLLPDYLQLLYKFLLDFFEELEQQFNTNGRTIGVSYLKQQVKDIVNSYYVEAKWLKGYMPSFDDYFVNGIITTACLTLTPASFLGMAEAANGEAFDWLGNKPNALMALAKITRLVDDVATYEVEKARGQIVTGIECYMYQYSLPKEDVVNEFNQRAEKLWKDLNGECLKPTPVSKHLLERIVNFTRLMEVTYREGDGYTHPEKILKGLITSLLKNPIPLL